MSLYYMPPPPPRATWPSLSLWVDRLKNMSSESRWVVAGLVLAQVMVVAIYMLLVGNLASIEQKRAALEQQAQDKHHCAMLDGRLERRECYIALQMRDNTQTTVVTVAQQ